MLHALTAATPRSRAGRVEYLTGAMTTAPPDVSPADNEHAFDSAIVRALKASRITTTLVTAFLVKAGITRLIDRFGGRRPIELSSSTACERIHVRAP
jgi:hypothetical protein